MDTPPPATVGDEHLAAALSSMWCLEGGSALSYVPKGVGSYHWVASTRSGDEYFVTVDDLDTKPWLGRERSTTFEGLVDAYATARGLRDIDELEFVVAPIPSTAGEVCVRLSPQYTVALFPLVAGRAGRWGEPLGEDDRGHLLGLLARLHRARPGRGAGSHTHSLAERRELLTALDAVQTAWTGGPFAERARRALVQHLSWVREALGRFDELAARLDRSPAPLVVTHGEPHPGNLIHTDAGLRLIDWDTVALAEPERDLWMVDAAGEDPFAPYERRTGRHVDERALEFYRLKWALSDVASLAAVFRGEHADSAWAASKFEGLLSLLQRGAPAPYGAP